METRTITNNDLELLVSSQSHASFQQSWAWGEYENQIGREVVRYGVFAGETPIAAASFFKLRLPGFGHYWYCPRGPVILGGEQEEILKQIIEMAKKLGKKSGAVFIRFSPAWTKGSEFFQKLGCVCPRILLNRTEPDVTWLTNLTPAEDMLLESMHEKTRYNIRLAERKGVTVTDQGLFDDFWSLMQITAERQGIGLYPRDYYEKLVHNFQFSIFNFQSNSNNQFSKPQIKLFISHFEKKPLATAIVVGFGDTVTYLYGGSANEYREVMAPHILHWQIMQWAKQAGYLFYDWWGISPKNSNNQIPNSNQIQNSKMHPWEKLSRFKRGFGGAEYNTIGTFELILRPVWYSLLGLAKKARP